MEKYMVSVTWKYDSTQSDQDGREFDTLEEALDELAKIDIKAMAIRAGESMCKKVIKFVDGVGDDEYGCEEYDSEELS